MDRNPEENKQHGVNKIRRLSGAPSPLHGHDTTWMPVVSKILSFAFRKLEHGADILG